ncbi:Rne/Rng family ribonuclease [Sphingomonas sp. ASV193]|uniref:Rne/Rng family ribonuclease n=1 Tax=Sphingomonas sp. ASV193 TaxID=3144405 RepID=UPI0032E9125D
MSMRMLIDARHPEETRVAVAKGNRIEEFDFESAEHKQLKGNIYLAKVTRVEPSLQAAFIEYGGNRHGFLAFSEIHPDYYQIPKADRDALLREEAEHAAEEERLRAEADDYGDDGHDDAHDDAGDDHGEDGGDVAADATEVGTGSSRSPVDESAADELRKKRQALRRRYKIQDVIQRRQVLLVQVVKEERGNKGAALTTYLSLAGRYCVLMPNTSHGGGISRKISNGADRKRLKQMMSDLNLPQTMGLIVRTAGLERTKTEIKRDFDYLARLWDEIREKTLSSSAPALIYRDSDLVKRAIRDLYNKDIDEVIVEGENGYKAARGFMKLLMPSHVKKVRHYDDATPIFQRYGVEDQLNAMYQPVVQLKSGGYLVINPTEALVSIDINSGRSTREHNIEQTAFATNVEAAHEIARQLRLRDMAGLVVIDFIDMEQNSHNRKVEKAMKDALKNDRARIQVGRISSFGLMEMSRQRLRTGVLEASTKACPHCEGTGLMRTASSAGLSALRILEEEAARGRGDRLILRAGREAAIYVLNKKRAELAEIEARYGVTIEIVIDEALEGARMNVDSTGNRPIPRERIAAPIVEEDEDDVVEEIDEEDDEDDADGGERGDSRRGDSDDQGGRKRRRRRRGGRGRRNRDERGEEGEAADHGGSFEAQADGDTDDAEEGQIEPRDADDRGDDGEERSRSRRGRRGGRGRRGRGSQGDLADSSEGDAPVADTPMVDLPVSEEAPVAETQAGTEAEADAEAEAKPKTRRRPRARAAAEAEAPALDAPVAEEAPAKPKRSRARKVAAPVAAEPEIAEPTPVDAPAAETAPVEAPAKPKRSRAKKVVDEAPTTATEPAPSETPEPDPAPAPEAEAEEGEPRRGWWQRTFG